MVEPMSLTGATLVALAANKFVESTAKQLGDVVTPAVLKQAGKQIDVMWAKVKQHFTGNKKAENAIAQVEADRSPEALNRLAVYLDDDLQEPHNKVFADSLRQMAEQIINIGQQKTETTTNNIINIRVSDINDEAQVNVVGEINHASTVNIGNGRT